MNARTIQARLTQYFTTSRYPIQFAYLFGSHARGQALSFSDVDVGVYVNEPDQAKRSRMYAPMLTGLMDALHTDQVDLVYLNDAPPRFAYNVISGKPIYCANERARVRVETNILSRYPDECAASQHYYHYLDRRILAGKIRERTPEMIDTESVRERLIHIQKMLQRLERFRTTPRKQFIADEDSIELAAFELQTCIEAMADISTHLIAAMGLEKPAERRDAPVILAKHGIFPKDLGERLAKAVGMRNLIVHGYLGLIPGDVYDTIQTDLHYLDEFTEHITQFIQKQEKKERVKPKKGAKQ